MPDITPDWDQVLLAGAIMGVIVTSRPFVRAMGEWFGAFRNALKWIRRRTLDELYHRVHVLEKNLVEHESDRAAHNVALRDLTSSDDTERKERGDDTT